MSSAEPKSGHRSAWRWPMTGRALACLITLAGAAGLAGCGEGAGFRPLYGSAALGGAGTQEKLATVDFAPIPGRVGQRLRNELIFEATGGGGVTVAPEYRLDVAVNEYVSSTLVAIDGNASGQVYNLDASFRLIRLKDKSVVVSGTSYGRAGFERVTSIYANVRARENAENRAAKTVGEEMRTRLLAFLSRPA